MNIDKNIVYLGWVSFFTDMASSMVTTLLPIFIVYILNEGVDKLGVIISVSTFISYIFRIVFGYFSDKYQIVKPFVIAGYVISAVTKPLLYFSTSYVSVAALRSVERMGKAVRSSSKDVLISSFVKNKEHGRTFGFHKMMDISGELIGALLILLIFLFVAHDEKTIRVIFALTVLPSLIAVVIVVFLVKDKTFKPEGAKDSSIIHKRDLKLLVVLFVYFGFMFFLMSEQFFIVKAKAEGYALSVIPVFVMTLTFVQTVSSYFSGFLIDKIGVSKSLLISYLFAIISILFVKINLWVSFVFIGVFTVLSVNAIRAVISSKAISKGFIYGVFYGGVAVSSSLGALVIGFVWKLYGIDIVIIFSEIGMGLMFVTFLVLAGFTNVHK